MIFIRGCRTKKKMAIAVVTIIGRKNCVDGAFVNSGYAIDDHYHDLRLQAAVDELSCPYPVLPTYIDDENNYGGLLSFRGVDGRIDIHGVFSLPSSIHADGVDGSVVHYLDFKNIVILHLIHFLFFC
jgi:hypothetical protein